MQADLVWAQMVDHAGEEDVPALGDSVVLQRLQELRLLLYHWHLTWKTKYWNWIFSSTIVKYMMCWQALPIVQYVIISADLN